MSFIYSQALEAVYLEANCSGIDASAPLSGNPTPKLSLSHDRTMDASRLSRFGMTCKPLTESRGAELLTWWLAGFRAKTSALQEKAQELTEPGQECGDTWLGWLAKFDPNSSSWKTAQLSLIGDSGESLATFPRSGMTRGGLLWELPMLERPTTGSVFGFSLPTPVASDASCGAVISKSDTYYTTKDGKPRKINRMGTDGSVGLARLVKMWPGEAQNDGELNPQFSEWLMGWPIGHTELQPSATVKFHCVQPQPGELLEDLEA